MSVSLPQQLRAQKGGPWCTCLAGKGKGGVFSCTHAPACPASPSLQPLISAQCSVEPTHPGMALPGMSYHSPVQPPHPHSHHKQRVAAVTHPATPCALCQLVNTFVQHCPVVLNSSQTLSWVRAPHCVCAGGECTGGSAHGPLCPWGGCVSTTEGQSRQ